MIREHHEYFKKLIMSVDYRLPETSTWCIMTFLRK